MILDFEPGDKVINPTNKNWGIGQVQSIIKGKVTVNFERKENIVIHTVYEFKQEELKYLGFEITENVLPYVIQKKGESPYMLKETMKGSREFGRGLKPVSSSLTKPTFNKKLNEKT